MIDALLYAVRDGIRVAGMNYGKAECEIMDEEGKPPARCGNWFVAVHKGQTRTDPTGNERNLYELFDFSVTLTGRVTVPLDRVGDQQIARNLMLKDVNNVPLAQRQGFNAKMEQLRGYLHSNWQITVLTGGYTGPLGQTSNTANDNLIAWCSGTVYGFCEPARYAGSDSPVLVGGEWFSAEPDSEDVGLKSTMRFTGAKRMQPQTAAIGPFV